MMLLNYQKMSRDYRAGIKGILSLGPAPTKPRIIKSETDPYEDLFSLDTPVDLTPLVTPKVETKVTPKVKKEGPMQRRAKELRWIARPKLTEEDIQKAIEARRIAEMNSWTLGKGAIENWEAEDPATYAQNKGEVIDLLADLVKIKRRRPC